MCIRLDLGYSIDMQEVRLSRKIKEQLRGLGVAIVYLFGSRAQETNSPQSDYDIGVVFLDPRQLRTATKLYPQIYDLLTEVIPDLPNGPHPDIAFLQTANPALQAAAIKYGIILFETDSVFTANYIEEVVKRSNDYLPLKREFEEATFRAFQ